MGGTNLFAPAYFLKCLSKKQKNIEISLFILYNIIVKSKQGELYEEKFRSFYQKIRRNHR